MSGHHRSAAQCRSSGQRRRLCVAELRRRPPLAEPGHSSHHPVGIKRCPAHSGGVTQLPHPPARRRWERRLCAAGPEVSQGGESLRLGESLRVRDSPAQTTKPCDLSRSAAARRGLQSNSSKHRPSSKAQLAQMTDSGGLSERTAGSQDWPGNSGGPLLSGCAPTVPVLEKGESSQRTVVRSDLPGMSGASRPSSRGGIAPRQDLTAARQTYGHGGTARPRKSSSRHRTAAQQSGPSGRGLMTGGTAHLKGGKVRRQGNAGAAQLTDAVKHLRTGMPATGQCSSRVRGRPGLHQTTARMVAAGPHLPHKRPGTDQTAARPRRGTPACPPEPKPCQMRTPADGIQRTGVAQRQAKTGAVLMAAERSLARSGNTAAMTSKALKTFLRRRHCRRRFRHRRPCSRDHPTTQVSTTISHSSCAVTARWQGMPWHARTRFQLPRSPSSCVTQA